MQFPTFCKTAYASLFNSSSPTTYAIFHNWIALTTTSNANSLVRLSTAWHYASLAPLIVLARMQFDDPGPPSCKFFLNLEIDF